MLNRVKRNRSEGFTIIEIMIVLVIVALILLIIFLAVPALQRNSRNTQRKSDVNALLAAFTEYSTNNNGLQPVSTTPPTIAGDTLTFNVTAPATVTTQARVGYFNRGIGTGVGQVSLAANGTTVPAGTLNTPAEDYVMIIPQGDCGANNAVVAGNSRSVAAVYEIENGNNNYAQICQSS